MLCIAFDTQDPELLLGMLAAYSFQGFQEFDNAIEAYIAEQDWAAEKDEVLAATGIIAALRSAEPLPEVNWNETWESSFHPVMIDDYCAIRASFHEPIGTTQYEIVIDPKMAFGTGHHETTELMIRQMRAMDFSEKSVLDLGSGTGILGILAAMRGASPVLAVDYDPEATRNALENVDANEVHVECLTGVVTDVQGTYDIILANINRNVLLEVLPELHHIRRQNTVLLLSGILIDDQESICTAALRAGFVLEEREEKGEWLSLRFRVQGT